MAIYIRLGDEPEIYHTKEGERRRAEDFLLLFLQGSTYFSRYTLSIDFSVISPVSFSSEIYTAVKKGGGILVSGLSEGTAKVALDALNLLPPERAYEYLLKVDERKEVLRVPDVQVSRVARIRLGRKENRVKIYDRDLYMPLDGEKLLQYFSPVFSAFYQLRDHDGIDGLLCKLREKRVHSVFGKSVDLKRNVYVVVCGDEKKVEGNVYVSRLGGKSLRKEFEKCGKSYKRRVR